MDINECSRGSHGCDRNSYCVNTAGSWKCICNNGWYPDPANARLPTCRDVNECVDKPNACPWQSTCINVAGSYRCNCLSGWRNQGPHSCSDINECSEGTAHRCPSNSRCGNTPGSYRCNCISGWRNRGDYSCVDINECLEGRYSCPGNSRCVNTQGAYRCDCNRCFYRSGNRCNGMYNLMILYFDQNITFVGICPFFIFRSPGTLYNRKSCTSPELIHAPFICHVWWPRCAIEELYTISRLI